MGDQKQTRSTQEYIDKTYSRYPSAPDEQAPNSMEEYIARASDPMAMARLVTGSAVEGLALTPEELAERDQLRKEYIASVKQNLTAQLDNTYLVDAQGNKRKLRPEKSDPQ